MSAALRCVKLEALTATAKRHGLATVAGALACHRKAQNTFESKMNRYRQLELRNAHLEHQIAFLRCDHIPAVDLKKWGGETVAAVWKSTYQIGCLASSIVGMTVAEAEDPLRKIKAEIVVQRASLKERIPKHA